MADTSGIFSLLPETAAAKDPGAEDALPEGILKEGILKKDILPGGILSAAVFSDVPASGFRKGLPVPQGQHSIASLLTGWCRSLEGNIRPSTYSSYTYQVERALIPYLGDKMAEDFNEQSMAEFLLRYREEGRKNGSKPSESTLYSLEVILRRAFLYAVNQGILTESPLGRIQMRPRQDAELAVLPAEAVDALKRQLAAKPGLTRLEILLPLYTGCILSELCALSWGEVSLGQGEIRIRRNLLRVRATGPGSRAKTVLQLTELAAGGQRTIHIPEVLRQELSSWKSNAALPGEGIYLLTGTDAFPDPRTYQKHIRATLAGCGIGNGSLTMLRDTYAVMCLERGAGEYSLARHLGIETERLVTRYREYLQPDNSFVQRL